METKENENDDFEQMNKKQLMQFMAKQNTLMIELQKQLIEQNKQLNKLIEKNSNISSNINSNSNSNDKQSSNLNENGNKDEEYYEGGKRICEVIINQTSTSASVAALIGGFAITGYMQVDVGHSQLSTTLALKTLLAFGFLLEMLVIFISIQFAYVANRNDRRKELIKLGKFANRRTDTATIIISFVDLPLIIGIFCLIAAVSIYAFDELSTIPAIFITCASCFTVYLGFVLIFVIRCFAFPDFDDSDNDNDNDKTNQGGPTKMKKIIFFFLLFPIFPLVIIWYLHLKLNLKIKPVIKPIKKN
eukprot:TRINITY_DN573_c0_g2_i1.p1 TRINITY_DN573_c0_g2~~TRINITY_DN573_c0_g2_i1.p1  ORF type:complete len:303 (+),score=132.15 TRINITY_DN573_c0_g2_i1:28-936(+)